MKFKLLFNGYYTDHVVVNADRAAAVVEALNVAGEATGDIGWHIHSVACSVEECEEEFWRANDKLG